MQRIGNVPSVVIGGKTFSATQIIDKTLIARVSVPVYRSNNLRKPFARVRAGAPVGIVYSWIGPTGNVNTGGKMYWQFYDSNGQSYYAEQNSRSFDLSSLRQQGALTAIEQAEQEQAQQPKSWQSIALSLGITAIVVFAGAKIISNAISPGR